MDLTRIRTNRNAVVSVHFGRSQITTNIWWEHGWYVITNEEVISLLKDIKRYEGRSNYDQVEYLVNHLRSDFDVTTIGTPYRRDRASHSNLGRRQGGAPRPVVNQTSNTTLTLASFDMNRVTGESMTYDDIQQIASMKDQTFGVEIEMSCISKQKAAETVADFFGTTASYDPTYGHSSWICRDRQGRVWIFQYDGSLYGESCEMTTPILTYADMETLQAVIRKLRAAGAKSSVRYNCGVHVHVGANGHTPQTLKNLAIIMHNFERLLDKAIDVSQGRHTYCKFMDENFYSRLLRTSMDNTTVLTSARQANNSEGFVKFANVWYGSQGQSSGGHYNPTRYHITNFHSVFFRGTVEFRLFEFKEPDGERQNGLHAGEAKAFIQMALALNAYAKVCGNLTDGQVNNAATSELDEMYNWLQALSMCGDEFATAREYYTRRLI